LRTIDDANHFLLGTNGLTSTDVFGNLFEVTLRGIPIALGLDPNFVVGHNSSFYGKTCPLQHPPKNHPIHLRTMLSTTPVDLLPLIPNLFQKLFAGLNFRRSLDSLRRTAVNHAHHAAALFSFRNNHFDGVGRRAKNRTYLRDVLHHIQQVYGIRITQNENEDVPGAQSLGVSSSYLLRTEIAIPLAAMTVCALFLFCPENGHGEPC
jgi:hypothetical protein